MIVELKREMDAAKMENEKIYIIEIMENVKKERDAETQKIIDNIYKQDWSFLE